MILFNLGVKKPPAVSLLPEQLVTSVILFTVFFGVPGRSRTCDPQLRRLLLYPTELRAHTIFLIHMRLTYKP